MRATRHAHLARILASGFAYQGEPSAHRGGAARGEPSGDLPPTAFVSFLQNHDQIGNRARGERLDALAPAAAHRGGARRHAARADAAAAVHGRGMGRDAAVSVLLRLFRRPCARRCARAGARNSRRTTPISRRTARCPIRSPRRRFAARCSTGTSAKAPHASRPARSGAPAACRPPRGDRPASRRPVRLAGERDMRGRSVERGLAARRRHAAAGRQPVRRGAPAPGAPGRPADLGRSGCRISCNPGRCIGVGKVDASHRPDRDLSRPAHRGVRLRPGRRARALSARLGHQPSLRLAVPDGARRQRRTATTSSTTAGSIPNSAARTDLPACPTRSRAADMGLILDFVPNHMGVGHADNAWWLDVLEWGPRSPYARLVRHRLDDAALSPRGRSAAADPRQVLWRNAGAGRDRAEIRRRTKAASRPGTSTTGCRSGPTAMARSSRPSSPPRDAADEPAGTRAPGARRPLSRSQRADARHRRATSRRPSPPSPAAPQVIARGLHAYRPRCRRSARASSLLHRLLERQHYRVAHWRSPVSEINYRRFFDINDLAGIRVEDPRTFHDAHELVARLIREGRLHGLRLDHIDGLHDPVQYARRLQRLIRCGARRRRALPPLLRRGGKDPRRGRADAAPAGRRRHDRLRRAQSASRGCCSTAPACRRSTRTVAETSGRAAAFRRHRRGRQGARARHHAVERVHGADAPARRASPPATGRSRDFTLDRLRAALQLYIVHFPVYRTYISGRSSRPTDRAIDRAHDRGGAGGMVRRRRRHLRFSRGRADARHRRAAAAPAIPARACAASPPRCSSSPGRSPPRRSRTPPSIASTACWR